MKIGAPMKERELRECAVCSLCRKKLGESSPLPLFYRVTVERYGIKLDEIRKQAGLEMVLGGHVALAQAFSPDRDLAVPMMEPVTLIACEPCSIERRDCVGILAGIGATREAERRSKPEEGGSPVHANDLGDGA